LKDRDLTNSFCLLCLEIVAYFFFQWYCTVVCWSWWRHFLLQSIEQRTCHIRNLLTRNTQSMTQSFLAQSSYIIDVLFPSIMSNNFSVCILFFFFRGLIRSLFICYCCCM
jgi:hypothetical protein